ncbi:MAG: hypothetical protein VW455_02975 [Nitrospinota bacterium]
MFQKNPESKQRFSVFHFVTLLGLALCFRLPGINAVLASDELAMISLWGQMPYESIFQNYQYPNNHIFLTLILSFLLKTFGLYEWLLRIPTLVCGILSICLAFQTGKFFGKNIGSIVALILILSQWHIFFATNARGYLVIMLVAQICFYLLVVTFEKSSKEKRRGRLKEVLSFVGWLLIWVVGSWTLPTFVFFELSLLLFLSGFILYQWKSKKEWVLLAPYFSLLVGLAAFYIQYYVLISPEMLEAATSRAAKSPSDTFFGEVMAQWLAPFDSIKYFFLVFSLFGGWKIWKQNPSVLLLISALLLGPIFGGALGFKIGLLPGMPHARTYFYLQPFFLILAASGICLTVSILETILIEKIDASKAGKLTTFLMGIAGGALLLIATINTYQESYLKRINREPWKQVLNFTRSLGPNDLLIVPDALHVEFFLYGGSEMRQRVETILKEGKINRVYFLEYNKNEKSSFLLNKEKNVINLKGYPRLVKHAVNIFPGIPPQALNESARFEPFIIHQIKPEWLKRKNFWNGKLETMGVIGKKLFQWEKLHHGKDLHYKIRFVDTFLVALKKKKESPPNSLLLNLMNVSGSDMDFSAAVLDGKLKHKDIEYNPAWRINGWTLDHPYGGSIYNRVWNPSISISMGQSAISVLDVHFFKKGSAGIIKDFLTYEISMPENVLNLKVDKS